MYERRVLIPDALILQSFPSSCVDKDSKLSVQITEKKSELYNGEHLWNCVQVITLPRGLLLFVYLANVEYIKATVTLNLLDKSFFSVNLMWLKDNTLQSLNGYSFSDFYLLIEQWHAS